MIRIAFIVGMSRSATTWMSDVLNNHSEIVVFGETGFWGKHYLGKSLYSEEEVRRVLSKMLAIKCKSVEDLKCKPGSLVKHVMDNHAGNISPKLLFYKICTEFASFVKKSYVIEKTPHHVNYLDRIFENYPESKVIIQFRSPYDFMLSYKHQGDRKADHVRKTYQYIYHPMGCAMVYRGYLRAIKKAVEKYGDKVLLVPYEEVMSNPDDVLDKVQAFLGVDRENVVERHRINSSFPSGKRPELDSQDVAWMNIVVGNKMKILGYEPVSRNIWPAIKSVPGIPLWCFRVLWHLSRYQLANPIAYLRKWIFG